MRRGLRTEVLELDRHVPGTALDTGRRDDICNSMQFQAEFQKAHYDNTITFVVS